MIKIVDEQTKEEVQKPLSILRAEFINSLTKLINTSTLPPFIIEPILKDMYNDIKILSQKQLELDFKRYEDAKQNSSDHSKSK